MLDYVERRIPHEPIGCLRYRIGQSRVALSIIASSRTGFDGAAATVVACAPTDACPCFSLPLAFRCRLINGAARSCPGAWKRRNPTPTMSTAPSVPAPAITAGGIPDFALLFLLDLCPLHVQTQDLSAFLAFYLLAGSAVGKIVLRVALHALNDDRQSHSLSSCEFPDNLSYRSLRNKHSTAVGDRNRTQEATRQFSLSPAQISQFRRDFESSWWGFQREAPRDVDDRQAAGCAAA